MSFNETKSPLDEMQRKQEGDLDPFHGAASSQEVPTYQPFHLSGTSGRSPPPPPPPRRASYMAPPSLIYCGRPRPTGPCPVGAHAAAW